ncbi:NTP transferase domain-containing protein, partial [Lactonifactor longoviformis]
MTKETFNELYRKKEFSGLAPYKVENAVIMAAGFSSRFAPLSEVCPKALFPVKGEVLIERQIRQLQDAGIRDIYVVVGHKKELFYYLKE